MAVKELTNKEGKSQFLFLDISGGGWEHPLYVAIAQKLYPEYIERVILRANWHSSHTEILFRKNNVNAKLVLDEYDCIILESNDPKCNNELLKLWAEGIDNEIHIKKDLK